VSNSSITAAVSAQEIPSGSVPLVSVLISTYNQEQFIGQCLDSVLGQVTGFPVEILVHDDASTDDTASVVKTYATRFPSIIRPVLQKENQYSQARRAWPILHKLARGSFIAYCDGDDYWVNPDKLASQVLCLQSHPDFVLCFHDAIHINAEGKTVLEHNLPPGSRRDYSAEELQEMKWGWMLFGTMVHRNVGLDFPPEYHLVRNGDNFLPILLARYGGAKFLEAAGPLARRLHPGANWSNLSPEKMTAIHLHTYLQIASYFVRTGEKEAARRIIFGVLSRLIVKFFKQ
jgi:glycosyltransferase involved in cell wall biosynthesis